MFVGLRLEFKYLYFKMDRWLQENNFQIPTEKYAQPISGLFNLINLFIMGIPFIFLLAWCILISLWYLCIYTVFGALTVVVAIGIAYMDSIYNKELITIAVSLLSIVGIIVSSFQNKKQFIDEKRASTYECLTRVFIEALKGFTERKPMQFDEKLERYITYSSNKVLNLIIQIKIRSRKLNEDSSDKEIKDIIDYTLFLIDFMRYEISINRDIYTALDKYNYYSLIDILCEDYYDEQKQKYKNLLQEKHKKRADKKKKKITIDERDKETTRKTSLLEDVNMDRKILKARYNHLFNIVKESIDKWDAIGLLEMGAPNNEYDIETAQIVPTVYRDCNLEELTDQIIKIFTEYFGVDTFKTPREDIQVIAKEILEAKGREKDSHPLI